MKDCIVWFFILIMFVQLYCSCGSANTVYEDVHERVMCDSNLKYSLSLRNDTLVLCLTNDGDSTVYLFDSYITDYELEMGTLESDAIYRYNHDEEKYKISLLPLLPYLTYNRWDLYVFGERRLTRGGQVLYSFKQIKKDETACFKIHFAPRIDRWYEDVDVYKYNKWDRKGIRFKISGNRLKHTEVPKVYLELAVYNDTVGLSKDDYYYHEWDFNSKIKRFKTLLIQLPDDLVGSVFAQ